MVQPLLQHYPSLAPIDAYGNNGFRFADMSHRGGLMFLPTGVYGWPVTDVTAATLADFAHALAADAALEVLLIGTGIAHAQLPDAIVKGFVDGKLGHEAMTTGAAARTYNVLLAEKRRVGAALIAVP